MRPRVATLDDLDGVTETLWEAFRDDPLWHWAFPDHNRLRTWWRFYIESALRYPWVWVVDDYAAASVWIPPDGLGFIRLGEFSTPDERHRVATTWRDPR